VLVDVDVGFDCVSIRCCLSKYPSLILLMQSAVIELYVVVLLGL